MPDWIMKSYQISHFLALVPPAFYSYIFYGSEFLSMFESITADREVLIKNESEEVDDSQMTSVSLDQQ